MLNNNIKKIIYYCWFGGDKPQRVLDCINNWKKNLPDYKIIEINDINKELFDVEKECQNNLWFKTCYENKMWAYVADYARLTVLYENGGIYFDTDITIVKDIYDLLEYNKLILGWEDEKSIAAGVIISPLNDTNIKEMLDFYQNKIWENKQYTIPQIISYVITNKYKLNTYTSISENDDILILPPDYFYPLPYREQDKKNYITNNSYTIHWWDASWLKSNINYFLRNKHKKDLNKLIDFCFKKKIILNNPFIKIEQLCITYNINIDFQYFCIFKYKFCNNKRFLILYLLGIEIKLFQC